MCLLKLQPTLHRCVVLSHATFLRKETLRVLRSPDGFSSMRFEFHHKLKLPLKSYTANVNQCENLPFTNPNIEANM